MKILYLKRFLSLLSLFLFCFILFYSVFFIVFATISIDSLIGINLIVLFAVIYRNFGELFNSYFLNITKNIFINFYNLLSLTIELKTLILNTLVNYKNLFEYKFLLISYVYNDIKEIFNKYNKYLIKLCFNNFVLNLFLNKINLIQNLNKSNFYWLFVKYNVKIKNINTILILFLFK